MDTVDKKAEFDPVPFWFYGDGIWIQWKEGRIGSCIFMVLWRRDMDTVEESRI